MTSRLATVHLPRPVVVLYARIAFWVSLNARRSVPSQRRILSVACLPVRPPRGTQVDHIVLGGRPAERATLGRRDQPRAVLYLHGGGYVIGTTRMYRSLAAHLSRASAATVFTLDYRLAPEHAYPTALEDAVAAFRDLVATHGYAPQQIVIAGDSAGGGLAVATARALTDAGQRPAALALLSPWTDPSDLDVPNRDFVANKSWGAACAAMYRADADPADPGYAPLNGRLDGLPPMLVHYGAQELLRDQILRFIDAARAAGNDVQAVEHKRLWHSGHLLAGLLREATNAVDDAGAFLKRRLNTTTSHEIPASRGPRADSPACLGPIASTAVTDIRVAW